MSELVPVNEILKGDAANCLKLLPANCIDCVLTSPPYLALRDYGVQGQIGLESSLEEYIDRLCTIFDEIHRVLKPTGTCWVNLGDTYSATRSRSGKGQPMNVMTDSQKGIAPKKLTGLEDKNLALIPFRFAIGMQNRGWIIRNVI